MRKRIEAYVNEIISTEQLMKMAGEIGYVEFTRMVNQLIEDEVLSPVKASRQNGRRPPLYNRYRIFRPKPDYSDALEDIKLLHPTFAHSKYVVQPVNYVKYKKEIDALSNFLWEKKELLTEPLSINERSFQIWGIEKLLKDKSVVKSIFQFNGWDLESLNYYETPEPFFEYNFMNVEEMNVLIIENKDTWFSLRKIMQEGERNHFFRPYHVLLYGEGKKIINKNNRLTEYDQLLSGSRNTYYYFGDLDYEGINIYESLVLANPELDVRLAKELYEVMLIESEGREMPVSKEDQRKIDISQFVGQFDDESTKKIYSIIEEGLYIPQEILNYSWMKKNMKKGGEI